MKEAIILKINATNLIIQTIRKSLYELELKMNYFEYQPLALHYLKLPNGNYHQFEMRYEYLHVNLQKHINTQKYLFEEVCKLN